jgi:CRP-like cAMP-binding protein
MEIAALVEEHLLEPNELLLREGEDARYLFVIVEGSGIAQLKMYRGWLSLGLVGPREAAGWSSLVGEKVYPASIKALTPMRVARIESRGLALLMNLDPSFGYPVNKRLSSVFCRQYQAALEAYRSSGVTG